MTRAPGGPAPGFPGVPPLLLLIALGAASSACYRQIEETSVETLSRPGAGTLVVRLDRGSLSISEHAGSTMEIEIRRSAWALSPAAAQSALETLIVEAEEDESAGALVVRGRIAAAGVWRPGERGALRLRIRVPEGAAVDARTASGRIELRGLSGSVRAMTADGRIRAVSLRSPAGEDAEPIRLRSGEGRIEGEDLEGRVRAETGDGRIRLGGRLLEVTALSGDGRIEVDAAASLAPLTGEWLLRTASGRIRLALPQGADAELLVLAAGEPESGPDFAWERRGPLSVATVGDGPGARIHLRTGDGSARLSLGSRN